MSSQHIGIEDARKNLGPLVTAIQCGDGDVVLTRNGKPAARIVRYQEDPVATLKTALAEAGLSEDRIEEAANKNIVRIPTRQGCITVVRSNGWITAEDDQGEPGHSIRVYDGTNPVAMAEAVEHWARVEGAPD